MLIIIQQIQVIGLFSFWYHVSKIYNLIKETFLKFQIIEMFNDEM